MKRIRSQFALAAVSLACILVLAGCGSGTPVLTSISVSPATQTIVVPTTQQFTATGTYSDGSSKPGLAVTWSSSTASVATIDPSSGVATAVGAGSTSITAAASGVTSSPATLNVNQLQSIAVAPLTVTIGVGQTQQYAATGTFKMFDGSTSTSDITSQVNSANGWSSSAANVATIGNTGLATAIAVGSAGITAALSGVTSPAATLTVSAPVAVSLVVSPATPTVAVGNALTFTAQEKYSDGSLHPLSGAVAWTSGTPAAATILSDSGISAAHAVGTTAITATEGTLTPGAATLTVVTGTAHFAYVSNAGDSTVQWFTVNATTSPFLTSAGTVTLGSPLQAFLHPSGNYLYELDSNSNLWLYDVDSATGGLTVPFAPPQAVVGTSTANYGAVDPYGRFLYVSDDAGNNIYGFQISQTDGTLTAIPGSPFNGGAFNLSAPQFVVVDHSGSFLYAVNLNTATVSAYTINQSSGAIAPLATNPTISTGTSPLFATLDPSGTHLYVANDGDGTVSAYSIGTGGALTSLGAATPITGATAVFNVAVDPTGKYLYVLDSGDPTVPTAGQVYGYNIAAGGAIGSAITGTPVATGLGPTGISIDPTSSLIAVDNGFSIPGTISLLSIGSGGALTGGTSVPVHDTTPPNSNGSQPLFVIFYVAP